MATELNEFINTYFIQPIISPEISGYNLVNTGVFIVLLVIACAIIYTVLKKKIKFDSNFFIALIPYILFGVSMRVIMHQSEIGLVNFVHKTANPLEIGFWFFTPGIWILTFVIVVIGLLIAGILGSKNNKFNHKRLLIFGLIVCALPLLFNLFSITNLVPFIGTIILILGIAYAICYLINKFSKYKILEDKMNFFIVLGQGIDGIASAIAIAFFGFAEQHVVSSMLIDLSPALFAGVKLLLAVMICWSLDDYAKEKPERKNLIGFVKVIIAILGFATGLASLLKLGII